jgi:pyridoxamine 5'-phosphate oxidase
VLMTRLDAAVAQYGDAPPRPPHWGGFRITPLEIEFWADGDARLHDRFRWRRATPADVWEINRLSP